MQSIRAESRAERSAQRAFLIGLARAFGGAIIFSLPILMTMEMWSLSTSTSPARLLLLLVLLLPALVGISHFVGFEETFEIKDDLLDGFVAFGVGCVASCIVLTLFAVVGPRMSAFQIISNVALQALPASIGALLARSQLGAARDEDQQDRKKRVYGGELFIMGVGALFLAFNVAPTEEMVLIATMMGDWHALALIIVSIAIMHAFVYSVEFRGQADIPEGSTPVRAFLHFTVVGYAIALGMSAYILWTFGRTDGLAFAEVVSTTIVLAFPASVGAAAARLIL
jgi:putative integral membrane protein (TIGR02587 family)